MKGKGKGEPSAKAKGKGKAKAKCKGQGKGTVQGKRAEGNANIKLVKCGDTRHKEYSRVYHSVYALALQEGETSERAKFRARLVAKAHLAFK